MATPQTEATIVGGPLDNTGNAPPPVAPKAPETPPQAANSGFQPVYIGGRKFDNAEALATYTSELDKQRVSWEKTQTLTQRANEIADPDKALSDMFFEDTSTAIKLITEKAEKQALAKFENKMAQQNAVQQFYAKYDDLKEFSDLVDLTANRLQESIKQMPQTDAMEAIAKEARARIAAIKGTPTGGVELPSGPAKMASGSGGPATPVQVSTEAETLVDQIRRFQARGKK